MPAAEFRGGYRDKPAGGGRGGSLELVDQTSDGLEVRADRLKVQQQQPAQDLRPEGLEGLRFQCRVDEGQV